MADKVKGIFPGEETIREYNPGAAAWRLFIETPAKAVMGAPKAAQALADALERSTTGSGYTMSDMDPDSVRQTPRKMVEDVTDLAGTVAGSGAALPVESGAIKSFGGIMSKTAPVQDIGRARRALADGLSPEDVWSETGWMRGPVDKMWRYEIDDSGSFLNPDRSRWYKIGEEDIPRYISDQGVTSGYQAYMEDVLKHPELYKAYPELRKYFTFVADHEKPGGLRGQLGGNNFVGAWGQSPDDIRSVLLHELGGHGVQDIERFSPGTTRAYVQSLRPDMNKAQVHDTYLKAAGEAEARAVDARKDFPAHVRRKVYPLRSYDVPVESLWAPSK